MALTATATIQFKEVTNKIRVLLSEYESLVTLRGVEEIRTGIELYAERGPMQPTWRVKRKFGNISGSTTGGVLSANTLRASIFRNVRRMKQCSLGEIAR